MTIGYILDDTLDRSDGVQQAVLNIGEHMRRLGHDVHYIVAETMRTDIQNVHSVGSYFSMKFNGNSVRTPRLASKVQIQKLFLEVSFDVLHVQMPFSPFLAVRVLAMAPKDVKKVGTFHILPYSWFASAGTALLGRTLLKTIGSLDTCYAVSEPSLEFMERTFGVQGSVLPNPVDHSFFCSFNKQPSKKKQIVFIGRFEERKGVSELLEAYAALDEQTRTGTNLIMCGKGPLLDDVRRQSESRQLGISLPGFITEEEKGQYLANSDIAVFPSKSGESFGIVLAEAMAAGAGVTIGGNNPGYASVLGAWPDALFDPTDIDAFAQRLSSFLDDKSLTESIGTEQREAVKRYDVKVVAKRLLDEAY